MQPVGFIIYLTVSRQIIRDEKETRCFLLLEFRPFDIYYLIFCT